MTDFYCAAPWRGLHINPRGDVKTCCAGNPNLLGNLNENSIVEILNGSILKQVRSQLAQGIPHAEYCINCVQAERHGGQSERHWHNNVNTDFDYTRAGEQYHYPVIVDVRWNITCNLSCNYCGDKCSSKWASLKGIPFKSGARPYYDQVCDFIEQHQSHIHEVALVGGEPFLLPENERLLDVIPKHAIVTLITNLSVDLGNNKIFKKLSNRRQVGWSISFDNVGDQFEYVRYGASWKLLKHNIKLVRDLIHTQGHWAGIHAVYNLYNATRICELRTFAEEQGLQVHWQNLFQPEYLDPARHGAQVAALSAAEIEKFYKLGIATDMERSFFDQALQTYQAQSAADPKLEIQFKQHIGKIETVYHKDKQGSFEKLWPELEFLL
jgi:MoaA/NifB/PqqE/SkfB family radical SAM enzyme